MRTVDGRNPEDIRELEETRIPPGLMICALDSVKAERSVPVGAGYVGASSPFLNQVLRSQDQPGRRHRFNASSTFRRIQEPQRRQPSALESLKCDT